MSVSLSALSFTASLSREQTFPARSGAKDEQRVESSGQEPVALPGSQGAKLTEADHRRGRETGDK